AATYTLTKNQDNGGYLFADYNWKQRYNAGASFEHFEDPDGPTTDVSSYGAFAGLALMEETTAFRLDWRHTQPNGNGGPVPPKAANDLTLRVIFAMGPHKAHQF